MMEIRTKEYEKSWRRSPATRTGQFKGGQREERGQVEEKDGKGGKDLLTRGFGILGSSAKKLKRWEKENARPRGRKPGVSR